MSGIWQYNKWEIGFKDQEFTRFFFLKTFFDFPEMDKNKCPKMEKPNKC